MVSTLDKSIIKSSCFLYKNKSTTKIETEAIFGETFVVEHNENKWSYGYLQNDGYYGWILSNCLSEYCNTNYKISKKWAFIYEKPDPKSKRIMTLYLNSFVNVISKKNNWSKVIYIKNSKKCFGYIFSKNLDLKSKMNNWILTAKSLLGTPYLWGGKTPEGLDCSALIQLSYACQNILIPRNSYNQFKISKKLPFLKKNLSSGNLIYWKGHIGIILDQNNFLHANGYHMRVEQEPIDNVIKRLGKGDIIRIKFN